MPNPVLVGENAGARLWQIGRIGLDTGAPGGWKDNQDTSQANGFAYTATLRSDDQSPSGEGGKVLFKRVDLRIRRSGGWIIVMRVFVDGVQTQRWDNTVDPSVLTNQSISFASADFTEPVAGEDEVENLLEAAIDAMGTFISVELVVTSTDQTGGLLLIEGAEVHYYRLGEARTDVAAEAV